MISLYGNPIYSKSVWERWYEEQGRPSTLERVLLKNSSLPTQYPADGPVWPPPRSPDCWHTAILKENERWYNEHGIGEEI